jgi:sulfite reductase alpha subunit-like flavoprotein
MARDVVRTLTVMKMVYSDVDEQQATSWLKQMHYSNQLLEDVWG